MINHDFVSISGKLFKKFVENIKLCIYSFECGLSFAVKINSKKYILRGPEYLSNTVQTYVLANYIVAADTYEKLRFCVHFGSII